MDFSPERFKKFLPDTDRYFVFDYDEDGSDEENLQSVAEMAGIIQDFVGDDEDVRLLEYSGLKVDKILYSNYDRETH